MIKTTIAALAVALLSTAAQAYTYQNLRCTAANGGKFEAYINNGSATVRYDDKGEWTPAFTEVKDGHGLLTHIGTVGTMALSLNFKTGRGYMVTVFDDGRKKGMPVVCRFKDVER